MLEAHDPDGKESILLEAVEEFENVTPTNETIAEDGSSATLSLAQRNMTMIVGLVQEEQAWKFHSIVDLEVQRNHRPRKVRNSENDTMVQLRQIGVGIMTYAQDMGSKLPKELKEIAPYLQGEREPQWLHPTTRKAKPFVYRAGLDFKNFNATTLLAATPEPHAGKRIALFTDGHVETMTEEAFLKKAGEQKWLFIAGGKLEDVDAKAKEEIDKLIIQLSKGDYRKRGAAKKRLKELRDTASPALKQHLTHPDPEVRMTLKEILGD